MCTVGCVCIKRQASGCVDSAQNIPSEEIVGQIIWSEQSGQSYDLCEY